MVFGAGGGAFVARFGATSKDCGWTLSYVCDVNEKRPDIIIRLQRPHLFRIPNWVPDVVVGSVGECSTFP
jgi:hypothetical protein